MKTVSIAQWGLPPARGQMKGFTVIELLIVIAIITILALLAIPSWRNYQVLNQVKDGLKLADSWKVAVANYYATVGNMPTNEKVLTGIGPSTSEYVSGISVNSGQILITFGNSVSSQIKGLLVSITPELDPNNDIVWICGGAPATLPDGTQLTPVTNTPQPVTDGTAVPPQYLPADCRAP
jgi:prepilin-type N-terminal cleavage/methylation domain-containing protein